MAISSALGGTVGAVPIGSVTAFAGSAAPSGWLLCGGQTVSRTQYSGLFLTIGTTYGAGDGSTTFALPDLRGRVIAGEDDMGGTAANRLTSGGSGVTGTTLGATGGAETHTLTSSQQASMSIYYGQPTVLDHQRVGGGGALGGYVMNGNISVNNGLGTLTALGGGGAHNNTQPTIVLNYIIKAA
jgi:microcystin-dependent protein